MRVRLPTWMAGEFVIRRSESAAAIVRSDFADAFDRSRLIEAAGSARRPALVGDAGALVGGRASTWAVPAGALGEAVVRRYRRGGLVRRVTKTRYLLGARAFRELIVTHRLWKRGAPVPECLAAVQESAGPGYRACLVTRRIAGAEPAAGVLAEMRPGEAATVLASIGRSVRLLHEAGGRHADLNAYNLLVPVGRSGVPVIIIDFDRARLHRGAVPRWRAARNLRRLKRSLAKLGLTAALSAWSAFLEAYRTDPEPPPAA